MRPSERNTSMLVQCNKMRVRGVRGSDVRDARLGVKIRPALLVLCTIAFAACAKRSQSAPGVEPYAALPIAARAQPGSPPDYILGNFEDDYGGRFTITHTDFVQLPRGRFHIVQWNVAQQYFIAQNDSLNRSDAGKWTRIDWLPLTGMAPYTWAFCFSAYKAATRADAELTATARRDAPKTGCNGFPFTRMRPRG